MVMVGGVEISDGARAAGCLVCPNCGDTKFGSATMPDGRIVRTCHGSVNDEESCSFQWPSGDDHLYFYLPLWYVRNIADTI